MNSGDKAVIRSLNISEKKGVVKEPRDSAELYEMGIRGDAHAGTGHRQVSLLALESIRDYEKKISSKLEFGAFGENVTTEGLRLHKANILDRFVCGPVDLEVTQIGKKCHGKRCAIYKDTGDCIMPGEGIFARVLSGGALKRGDQLEYRRRLFSVKVITLSDRAFAGTYPDRSGERVKELAETWFREHKLDARIEREILPDDRELFAKALNEALIRPCDILISTGSTGLGNRDIAPQVAMKYMEKQIPGIVEHVRFKYGQNNPNALLSRSVAGTSGKTLLFILPGSVRAVGEYLEEIFRGLRHMILMVNNIDSH